MSELRIFFGSQTGNAKNLAFSIAQNLADSGIDCSVEDMGEVDPESIHLIKKILIVTSTYGDGEAPDNASEWMSYLKFNSEINLENLQYAVLGLGDTYYPHFCQAAKDFDEYLSKRGAHALQKRLDCDLYYEEQYQEWINSLIRLLK